MIARAREWKLDLEMEKKRKPEGVKALSAGKNPRYNITDRGASRATTVVASAESCTRERGGHVVRAALSAAEVAMLPGTVQLPPSPPKYHN